MRKTPRFYAPGTFIARGIAAFLATALASAGCGPTRVPEQSGARREEVRVVSGDVSLAGTVLIPSGSRMHGAILLLHGSGPETRAALESDAQWFADQGLVVLMYDKRGTGKSTGNLGLASYADLAVDAAAAINLLRSRPEVDRRRIGIWGPSEGGWVAPIAASRSPDVRFVILKSGIGVTPEEQMKFAWTNSLRASAAPDSTIAAVDSARKLIWIYVRTSQGESAARDALEHAKKMPCFPADPESVGLIAQVPPPSFFEDPALAEKVFFVRTRSRFDPEPFLERLRVPTLAVFGGVDTDTPVRRTVDVLRAAFARSGNRDLTIAILPGDDHYLEHEIAGGKRGMDPEYYRVMRGWLAAHNLL
jgi:pimeloyl-ACP methyl ester carboxylesterase